MAEPIEIQLGSGESDRISLIFKGRRYPDTSDFWHGNWLLVDVEIQVGTFSGNIDGETRNEHVQDFYEELRRLNESLVGTAKLGIEKWVEINVEAEKYGSIQVYGHASDDQTDGNKLQFRIKTDQSYLNQVLKGLHKVIELYPIVYAKE
ncbi:MAG: hypothetical protein WBC91_25785 [Phototrophicaceae bacterium]